MLNTVLAITSLAMVRAESWMIRDLGVSENDIQLVMLKDFTIRLQQDLVKSQALTKRLVSEARLTVYRDQGQAKVRGLEAAGRWANEAMKQAPPK